MTSRAFDLERVRHNWDRLATPPPEHLPERLRALEPPRDPLPEAELLLERITAIAYAQFAPQRASLEPFLGEARQLLSQMRELGTEGGELAPLRKKFQAALDDLQDLFEVYAGIGLR